MFLPLHDAELALQHIFCPQIHFFKAGGIKNSKPIAIYEACIYLKITSFHAAPTILGLNFL